MVKKGDTIKISGIAVREGTSRNKRKYISKELKKFAPSLIGRPLLKDHIGSTDNVIGRITNAEFLDNANLITYEGWVKEDGSDITERIKDGRINEVSIGAIAGRLVKESEDSDVLIPKDMEALELSTTPVPGVRGTSVFSHEDTKVDLSDEAIKKMISDYDNSQESHSPSLSEESKLNINERGKIMESKKPESTGNESVDNGEVKALREELETLKAEREKLAAEKEKVEEARRQDAIERYKEKVQSKGLEPKDLSNASMETIRALTEMAEQIPAHTESEEADEEEAEEEEEEADEENVKPKAKPKSRETTSENKNLFEGYVLDGSDTISGFAFYKNY